MKTKAKLTILGMALAMSCGGFTEAHATKKHNEQCMTMHHSSDADANFIRDMIPHHQMAVDMAEKELKYGKDKAAREMAQNILDAQKKEISDMKAWLKTHK